MNPERIVPTSALRPLVEAYLRERQDDAPGEALRVLALRMGSRARDENNAAGWVAKNLARKAVSLDFADALVSALDRPEAWWGELAPYLPRAEIEDVVGRGLCCEDCGVRLTPDNYGPIDLFRFEPAAPAGKRRRAGGRRFRQWDLCRRCRGLALAKRGGTNTRENGRRRYLATRERVTPKRGGRPRLLTDEELRALHTLYLRADLSMPALARQLLAAGRPGTQSGYVSAMLLGWRRLGLRARSRNEAVTLARWGRDYEARTMPKYKRCEGTNGKGKTCGQWAVHGSAFCIWHADQAEAA